MADLELNVTIRIAGHKPHQYPRCAPRNKEGGVIGWNDSRGIGPFVSNFEEPTKRLTDGADLANFRPEEDSAEMGRSYRLSWQSFSKRGLPRSESKSGSSRS